jgi:predicted phosphodiesterase
VRTAVLADIHANLAALEAVVGDIRTERISEIVTLGDNIGYGPDPDEVTQELIRLQVFSIQGNHEYALLNPVYYFRMNPIAKRSLDLTKILLSKKSLTYALGLQQMKIHHGARLVHGCPPKSQTAYLFSPGRNMLDKLFSSFPEKICFYGHTHIMSFFAEGKDPDQGHDISPTTLYLESDRKYIINPGSVGQPRDLRNNHAKYIIWDREQASITFKEVAYDVMRTVNKLRLLDFPPSNAERLLR